MNGTQEIRVKESGVSFAPFAPDNFFHMEKSDVYKKLGKGYSTVEFLWVDAMKNFIFVEAKSSSPRPDKTDHTDFDKYIDEISDKFQDSYQLFLASVLGRRKSENMGKEVRGFKADSSNIKFVLVIPTHKFDWLVALNDALKKQLRKTISIWNIEIAVMNEELAREHGLLT